MQYQKITRSDIIFAALVLFNGARKSDLATSWSKPSDRTTANQFMVSVSFGSGFRFYSH